MSDKEGSQIVFYGNKGFFVLNIDQADNDASLFGEPFDRYLASR
jgi:hypothetical protein